MMTPTQGRREGEARMTIGMELAALHKERRIKQAQLAMLEAAMSRDDRTCTSDDMTADLSSEYDAGGKWVGAAVHALALARTIERVNYVKSARPSRHSADVKLWHVRDDDNAKLLMQTLRLWLERNPMPTEPTEVQGELFGERGTA